MKKIACLLANSLTIDSGRVVLSVDETSQLLKIAYLEGVIPVKINNYFKRKEESNFYSEDIAKMQHNIFLLEQELSNLVKDFKSQYALTEDQWLDNKF